MNKSKLKKQNRKLIKKRNALKKSVKKELLTYRIEDLNYFFKKGYYDFVKDMLDIRNKMARVMDKYEKDKYPIPKDFEELIVINSKIQLNRNIANSKPKYFKGDILITDPCYVLRNIDENKVRYIERDTIYGDWSCKTYDIDTKEILGRFCADSGMVAVISLDDVLKLNPNFDDYKNEYAYTVIRNFDGYVYFKVNNFVYEHKGEKCVDYDVQVVGKGNVNFITSQTGL